MIYLGNSLVILTVNMHMQLLCEFVCSSAYVYMFKCICLDVQVHVWIFKCIMFGCSSAYV